MVNHTSVLRPGEPPEPARPVPVFWKAAGSRLLVDRLTRRLVTLGGVLIIGSILAILFVIAAEVYPLFKQPKATRRSRYRAGRHCGAVRSRGRRVPRSRLSCDAPGNSLHRHEGRDPAKHPAVTWRGGRDDHGNLSSRPWGLRRGPFRRTCRSHRGQVQLSPTRTGSVS